MFLYAQRTFKNIVGQKRFPFASIFFILLAGYVIGQLVFSKSPEYLSFNDFKKAVASQNINSVSIYDDGEIKGSLKKPQSTFQTKISPNLIETTVVEIESKSPETKISFVAVPKPGWFWNFALILLPMIILFAIFFQFAKFASKITGGPGQFLRSRAKLYSEPNTKTTFKDIAGIDEAIDEVKEIVQFLKDPTKFAKLGGRIPKGILLVGPPGTGKTLLARAVAGEAGVPFHSISGSDFVEMFVGVGAGRVRDLFVQAHKNLPAIIFIDELDAVGRRRSNNVMGSHEEREQTLNQLLVEMDGFDANSGLIILAATNRPDVLDPALLRPGRFDRRVIVDKPDILGRKSILNIHTKKLPVDSAVNLESIARGTPGLTGADLANLCNEAALSAAKNERELVAMSDFEWARDRVLMGSERKSMVISENEKRITAYHEAGHAIVAMKVPQADPVHKVSIIPRDMALGITSQLPTEDKHNYTKQFLLSQLAILMGGRSAEELLDSGNITTGASNDIERATEIAERMVNEWGMSEMGIRKFTNACSEKTAEEIDGEIKRLMSEAHREAKAILTEHRQILNNVAHALVEKETLSGDEIKKLL